MKTAMILPSSDGQEYAMVVLFPSKWPTKKAEKLAGAAIAAGQIGDERQWSDIEKELEKRGFTVPEQVGGPMWD